MVLRLINQLNPDYRELNMNFMGLRILVVDDDVAILQWLRQTLTKLGHTVFVAGNGQDGLALALEIIPNVVISDWVMPRMDGVSLCRALRQTAIGPSLYIMILSSLRSDERIIEAFEAGVDDYLCKPVNLQLLRAKLLPAQRCGQRQSASP